MEYLIHADDLGLTEGITDDILDCFDHGPLTSTSLVPNGYAFDYAVQERQRRRGLRLAVHLNLAEGKPVCESEAIAPLLDETGQFHLSFPALWLRYLSGGSRQRARLREAVSHEMAAQIGKVRQAVGEDVPVRVDSHQHYHLIPFVFDALLGLRESCRLSYVRLPHEPFFWCGTGEGHWRNYLGPNLLKHVLLNALSRPRERRLAEAGLSYCHTFVGVLFTGNMSEAAARAALLAGSDEGTVEILFHPGRARPEEAHFWAARPDLAAYYLSPRRQQERVGLQSAGFQQLVDSLQGPAGTPGAEHPVSGDGQGDSRVAT